MPDPNHLSKRERQIMQIIYARGQASANDVLADLPAPPTRTTIRTLLRILEEKGHLSHTTDGREFVFKPTRARSQAGRSALKSVVHAFFSNPAMSISMVMSTHPPTYRNSTAYSF